MIRIFLQNQVKAVALLQVGTFMTILITPLNGAGPDGAAILGAAAAAARALGMGEKPLQTAAEFRQGKTLVAPKTMGPPINPELIHEAFDRGNGGEKFGVFQLTLVT
jgi:hypothetical protein